MQTTIRCGKRIIGFLFIFSLLFSGLFSSGKAEYSFYAFTGDTEVSHERTKASFRTISTITETPVSNSENKPGKRISTGSSRNNHILRLIPVMSLMLFWSTRRISPFQTISGSLFSDTFFESLMSFIHSQDGKK